MLQVSYKNGKKIIVLLYAFIHGLIFGRQVLVFRGTSKKHCEYEHDKENFIHLAEVRGKFDNIMIERLGII